MTSHTTWPADRFYWCVLDAPGWTRTGVPPPGVRQRLEDELPVPVDDLHAVAAPLPGDRLLVCAAVRDELRGVQALSLTPESAPEFAAGGEASRLNLLVGEFEPPPVRQARWRSHAVATVSILGCSLILSAGLLRRASVWSSRAVLYEHEVATLTQPGGVDALSHEISVARDAAESATATGLPDTPLALAAVLAGWPSSVKCFAQSVSVDRTGASISVTVEGDPEPFLSALRPPPGWRLDEPRLVNVGSVNRVTLKLRPEGGGT